MNFDYERLQVENARLRDEIAALKRDRDEWWQLASVRGKERDECLVWMSNVPVDAINRIYISAGPDEDGVAWDAVAVWLESVAYTNVLKLRARHGETYNPAHYAPGKTRTAGELAGLVLGSNPGE